ncbi:hypothetical protein [Ruminococcus flavefaciens]|uniref:hypothetical protein n=1 Tax=Ruminococcus flavefaciens TaxID=1265 RepID=UPI000467D106|nr:hypothetical protein [Ruminococcus flavefaciens]
MSLLFDDKLKIEVVPNVEIIANTDFEKAIYDLDAEIDLLSSHADLLDYIVAASSGVICGMLDILWVGDFNLASGRNIADEKISGFVTKTANLFGYKGDNLKEAVSFLEKKFPLASDGNTSKLGGGLQHHLRDFAHHPTIVGLIFSLLTQFTGYSFGTDTNGNFKTFKVPDNSKKFIGKNIPDKIIKGTIVWFFHLVSDIAGSSSTAGLSGGTGIPGPILSLAKELSALPVFKNIKVGDTRLSLFLSKLFNGTLLAQHDENGKIIKGTDLWFDFRGELGAAIELGKQALPVIANESLVRAFYFIRRLAIEIKNINASSITDLIKIDFDKVKPYDNPTLTRMLTVATGVFTTVDIAEAVISQKYFVSVNYIGIGRFAIAIGSEMINFLKIRDVKKIKQMYEDIQRNTYSQTDNNIYKRLGEGMDIEKFGLTLEQTEILYNLEMYKTINDINASSTKRNLKSDWLEEWKHYMSIGFADFTGIEGAELHWYSKDELISKVKENSPEGTWFRLVLLEAMLFEPYFPLSTEKDKKGDEVPSKKYKELNIPLVGYSESNGDKFLDTFFSENYYKTGYIKRLRKSYNKIIRELNEVLKSALKTVSIAAVITVSFVATAGMFAGPIAVALVGSNFAGLSGAALTSACLAYIGGGAIAAGGAGMLGGTMAIVGGGTLLGLGVGAGVGGTIGAVSVMGKKGTILQSAKLMVSVREIFLNDEHDIEYSNSVYEQYVRNIADIEKDLVELRLKADVADKDEKKRMKEEIKNTEEAVHAMKIAMKSMNKFNSSFEIGMSEEKK